MHDRGLAAPQCYAWLVADDPAPTTHTMHRAIIREFPSRWKLITCDMLQPLMSFNYTELAFRYELVPFNTAVKPFAFMYMFQVLEARKALFFDNDIWVMQPLQKVVDALEARSFVFTPHILEPYQVDGLKQDERQIMLAGVFNFGFCGIARSASAAAFLDWWAVRLRWYGFAEPELGMHFDQNWATMVVSYFDQSEYHILRDPAYNIAYWNLHYRGEHVRIESGTGTVMYDHGGGVPASPVVFVHFSGVSDLNNYNMEEVSKHQNRFGMADFPHLRPLFERYIAMLRAADAMRHRYVPYGFDAFADGKTKIHAMFRRRYRAMTDPGNRDTVQAQQFRAEVAADPFCAGHCAGGKLSMIEHMLQGAHHTTVAPVGKAWIPELVWALYSIRPDVQKVYPDPFGADAAGLQRWAASSGFKEHQLEALAGRYRAALRVQQAKHRAATLTMGASVVGWLRAVFGVAESSRMVYRALGAAGVAVAGTLLSHTTVHTHPDRSIPVTRDAPFKFNIFVANADNTPGILADYPALEWRRHYNIGYWAWELEEFPAFWLEHLASFDEIWTPSDFVTDAIAAATAKRDGEGGGAAAAGPRVLTMPFGLNLNAAPPAGRASFGLPADALVFLVAFDLRSCFDRKNPMAALRAFMQAFGPDDTSAVLVIKALLASASDRRQSVFKAEFESLVQAGAGAGNIRFVTEQLTEERHHELMATADVFLSLHRSEGFGLGLLEMMMRGKPVIATKYSGSMQFMQHLPDRWGFTLVDWEYTQVNTSAEAGFSAVYQPHQRWADPSVTHAAAAMRKLHGDRGLLSQYANEVAPIARAKFSERAAGGRMQKRLHELHRDASLWTKRGERARPGQS